MADHGNTHSFELLIVLGIFDARDDLLVTRRRPVNVDEIAIGVVACLLAMPRQTAITDIFKEGLINSC